MELVTTNAVLFAMKRIPKRVIENLSRLNININ